MKQALLNRAMLLHIGVIVLLVLLQHVLPEYHQGVIARVLVLTIYALGYNILFGYTGLLSLGHALYFAAGMYGAGLTMVKLDWSALAGFGSGIAAAFLVALVIGLLALRTIGVAFMIVTMMFAQAGYLTSLYFNEYTRGDEGFVVPQAARVIETPWMTLDLSAADTRYLVAVVLFGICMLIKLGVVQSGFGKVLVALRENEERTRMLGYSPRHHKLVAFLLSGVYAGIAGAAYAILFGYAGATFASIQYSILPLLWVLLGGAGVVLGPLVGTLSMYYLIDFLSELTSAYLLFVGVALVALVLLAPKGILGSLRDWRRGDRTRVLRAHRFGRWLP